MLQFNNITVRVTRPVTCVVVASALGVEPFELLEALIPLEVFVSPDKQISDDELQRLGHSIGVDFRIDEDGGAATTSARPTGPHEPPSLDGRSRQKQRELRTN